MKLPSREYVMPAGFHCSPTEILPEVWQDHVVRHPLGIESTARGAPWNREGWDRTKPQVISQQRRDRLVAAIAKLRAGAQRCLVPEFSGVAARIAADRVCMRCTPDLLGSCVRLCHEHEVGTHYATVVEAMLQAVEDGAGEVVTRRQLTMRFMSTAGTRKPDARIVVMSWGVIAAGRTDRLVARLSRSDGTRAEFYLDPTRQLRQWRTTYRKDVTQRPTTLGAAYALFLLEFPRVAPVFGELSDWCVVARAWWRSDAS